jgi:hypothetical protein
MKLETIHIPDRVLGGLLLLFVIGEILYWSVGGWVSLLILPIVVYGTAGILKTVWVNRKNPRTYVWMGFFLVACVLSALAGFLVGHV